MVESLDLNNKIKSVGKGLERTSAFPIDKWQLWDKFTNDGKLEYKDPSSGEITACDTAEQLAQLVAKSVIAYNGFTFAVVNNNGKVDKFIVENIGIDRNATKIAQYNNVDEIINDKLNNVAYGPLPDSMTISFPYASNTSLNGSYPVYGALISLSSYNIYSNVNQVVLNPIDFTNYDKLSLDAISLTAVKGINWIINNYTSIENVYLSLYELVDAESPSSNNFKLSENQLSYLGTSDTSATMVIRPTSESELPIAFTFNNSNIILDKTKVYLYTFTNTNDPLLLNGTFSEVTSTMVPIGIRVRSTSPNPESSTLPIEESVKQLKTVTVDPLNLSGAFMPENWSVLTEFSGHPYGSIVPQLYKNNIFTETNTFNEISANDLTASDGTFNTLSSTTFKSPHLTADASQVSANGNVTINGLKIGNTWSNNRYIVANIDTSKTLAIDGGDGKNTTAKAGLLIDVSSTIFTSKTGYDPSKNISITDEQQFTTKKYVDDVSSAIQTNLNTVSSNVSAEVSSRFILIKHWD